MTPDIEKASPEDIRKFQEIQLRQLLVYLSQQSPFYKTLFKDQNIDINNIQTLADLAIIPPTTKEHLQQFNDDFLCVPKQKIVDFVTTSGTLGEPVVIAMTDNDLERLAYNEAISLACAGITSNDTVQLMTTMDRRFMAGLAYFLGIRKLGASVIRVGAGVPELQWESIQKFKPTYIIAVPSFLLKLIEYAQHNGIDVNASGIKGAICIGEAVRQNDFSLNALGEKITRQWDLQLFATYASTEMSTAFTECHDQQGGHLHPELILVEILDENDQAVAQGASGELTITTLGVEAMPLLRFKTGDIVQQHVDPCRCGRNTLRLGPVIGRKKQMIKYKGTTLFPPAMINVLNQFTELSAFVIEIFHSTIGTDEICIKISSSHPDDVLLQRIKDHFRAKLRVTPQVEFHSEKAILDLQLSKKSRKPIMVIDKRS